MKPFSDSPTATTTAAEQHLVSTLFDLARELTTVLKLDELLHKIPQLLGRLLTFQAFGVYLLDEKRAELRVAYSEGIPGDVRFKLAEGAPGLAVAEQRPIVINDVATDPAYVERVPGMRADVAVPLIYQGKVIGVIEVLSNCSEFTTSDLGVLRQFAAHLAVALENARMFDQERRDAEAFETMAEIGREVTSILDVDVLLTRLAQLAKRLIDYRTFGILLVNEDAGELEMKLAVQYGEKVSVPRVKLGAGLVGHAALTKEVVLVSDVSKDPRYIKVVDDVRSELVVPMLLKDRCIGVLDLESPELDAFAKRDAEILTLLASQAAVAIENARLYETLAANEYRLEKEVRFAQRVQAALLPTELPKRLRGIDVAARFAPARELGGDLHDFLLPEPSIFVVALGDVSGKGVPAALYSAFAGELVRSRTYRRRYLPERSRPAAILSSMNTILHERHLEEYYCTLCYSLLDLKRRTITFANSGLPYPIRRNEDTCVQLELPGLPLGSFAGSTYDELTLPLVAGDTYVLCSDGVFEAMNAVGQEFGAARLLDTVEQARGLSADGLVGAIFEAVHFFRGDTPPNDDMTAVAVRITA